MSESSAILRVLLLALITATAWGSSGSLTKAPIVTLTQGKVKGIELASRDGNKYFGFYGIPYVKQPSRFQDPSFTEPPPKWEGIRDATKPGPACLQFDYVKNKSMGEEDCLFVNVYTRNVSTKLSAMAYIHGGGFQWGTSAIHGAKYLMDEEVVLVTFNYRLGPFGIITDLESVAIFNSTCFLSTGDSSLRGNMGMKDQVMALKWIQKNIANFGGNPDSVTLFGESAGGGAVSLHVLSPMSRGLFHRAISQSGAALNPWAVLKNPRLSANKLGAKLICPVHNSAKLVECLASKDPQELVAQSLAEWYIDPTVPFGPVVEQIGPNEIEQDEAFLSRSPIQILTDGSFNQVPWITGVCEDEGIYLHSAVILRESKLSREINQDWHRIAPITLTYYEDTEETSEEVNLISDAIRQFYFGAKNATINMGSRQALTNMYSDRYFVHGAWKTALAQARHGSPVYAYVISYKGKFSFLEQRGFNRSQGVTHKDDLQYLFSGLAPELTGSDADFSRKFVKLWTSFAKTGEPGDTWGSVRNWRPVSTEEVWNQNLRFYKLDAETQNVNDPFSTRMLFWETLMAQHPIIGFPGYNITSEEKLAKLPRQEL